MKTVNTLAIAAVLSSLSFASFAAVEVQSTPAGQHKVGTISASAGTNLGSLEDQLAQKADEMGATSYRITSVIRSEYPSRYRRYLQVSPMRRCPAPFTGQR